MASVRALGVVLFRAVVVMRWTAVPAGAGDKTGARRIGRVWMSVKGGYLAIDRIADFVECDVVVIDAEALFLLEALDPHAP